MPSTRTAQLCRYLLSCAVSDIVAAYPPASIAVYRRVSSTPVFPATVGSCEDTGLSAGRPGTDDRAPRLSSAPRVGPPYGERSFTTRGNTPDRHQGMT